jgi:hypothetical protein
MNGEDEKYMQNSAPRILKKMPRRKVNIDMALKEVKWEDLSQYWTQLALCGVQ